MAKCKVKINNFVRRQTADSSYTHFEGTEEELLELIDNALELGRWTTGYRHDVLLVRVDPYRFKSGLVKLMDGDKFTGQYVSRRPGETPRKETRVIRPSGKETPACVEVVLYSHEALAEGKENDYNIEEADYEVISINGYPSILPGPIAPGTLMHNHFGSDGGTATKMSAEEFEQALRESFAYHKDKALIA